MLADGCFDPLHMGHLRYLSAARELGRPLIVHIAPDEAIRAKGREPFQTRFERARTVLHLDMVDQVQCHDSLAIAVLSNCPRYLVKGSDWRGRLPDEVLQACREAETEIIYTETQDKTSTERLHDTRSV